MTSISLYGAYEEIDPEHPAPRFGRPKNRRPDSKQIQAGLAVCADGAVPVFHRAYDGRAGERCRAARRGTRFRPTPPTAGPTAWCMPRRFVAATCPFAAGLPASPALAPGQWNDYEIEVQGDTYTVRLNGVRTTTFTNTDAYRGRAATAADPTRTSTGFLGLQTHTGQVAFRNIQIADL